MAFGVTGLAGAFGGAAFFAGALAVFEATGLAAALAFTDLAAAVLLAALAGALDAPDLAVVLVPWAGAVGFFFKVADGTADLLR